MKRDEILKLLEEVGAIRQGHFELSSGRHSGTYIQCALVLQFPQHADSLGRALSEIFRDHKFACVVSPALGGVIIGHEVARALGVRALFGERVLVIEDVWTTGGSTRETIGVVEQEGGLAVAAGALIDRSGGAIELNVSSRALLEMEVPSYEPDECPQCRAGGVATRPGSRFSRAHI